MGTWIIHLIIRPNPLYSFFVSQLFGVLLNLFTRFSFLVICDPIHDLIHDLVLLTMICSFCLNGRTSEHSHSQNPQSFWSAPRIKTSGWLQHRKSVIHGLIVKSGKSDRPKMQNEYSAHAQKIGSGRFLVLTKRISAAGDKNDFRT